MTIVDQRDNRSRVKSAIDAGATYLQDTVTKENLDSFLSSHLSAGDFLLDLAWNIDANILLSRVMGAEVRLDPAGFDIGFRASWEKAIQDVIDRGGKPYAIPAGASDHELGGHGFAGWAFEVEDQEKELGFKFDKTIVCSVTGSLS